MNFKVKCALVLNAVQKFIKLKKFHELKRRSICKGEGWGGGRRIKSQGKVEEREEVEEVEEGEEAEEGKEVEEGEDGGGGGRRGRRGRRGRGNLPRSRSLVNL